MSEVGEYRLALCGRRIGGGKIRASTWVSCRKQSHELCFFHSSNVMFWMPIPGTFAIERDRGNLCREVVQDDEADSQISPQTARI